MSKKNLTILLSLGICLGWFFSIISVQAAAPGYSFAQGQIPPAQPAGGTTYYVDVASGSDTNNGLTPQTAFKTINKAVDHYSSRLRGGNRILVMAGTYYERVNLAFQPSGTVDEAHPFILAAYGNGEVIIDGSDTNLLTWNINPTNPNVYQATYDFKISGSSVKVSAVVMDDNYKTSKRQFQSSETAQQMVDKLDADGKWWFDTSTKTLYVNTGGVSPTTRDVVVVKYDDNSVQYGISLTGDYYHVHGLTVRGAGSFGILSSLYNGRGNHNTIEYNVTKFNGKSGIKALGAFDEILNNKVYGNVLINFPIGVRYTTGGWPNGCITGSDYAHIAGNLCSNSFGEGIGTMNDGNLLIEDNIIHDVFSTGIYLDTSPNSVVRRNLIYFSDPDWSIIAPEANLMAGSSVHKMKMRLWHSGISTGDETATNPIAQTANVQIYDNIIVNVKKGIDHYPQATGSGLRNFTVANNTIYMPSTLGPTDANNPTPEEMSGAVLNYSGGNNTNTVFANNIIYDPLPNSSNKVIWASGYSTSSLQLAGINSSNNLLVSSAIGAIRYGSWNGNTYSISDWRSAGNDSNGLSADPLFSGSGTMFDPGYYALQANSPAIDSGSAFASIFSDFWGNARLVGSATDIGAIEYGAIQDMSAPAAPTGLAIN